MRIVEIPKPNGGFRLLGIPTVIDRLIQQAIAQELNIIYDEYFSTSSYGFKPNKCAHVAIKQAQIYTNEGNGWVVDIDLEKFFHKVNHDMLINKLLKKIKEKRRHKFCRYADDVGALILPF